MKIIYHIPTEQFGFVEIEKEGNGTVEEMDSYDAVKAFVVSKMGSVEGLDPKTWNSCIDEYLLTNELKDGTNLYERMNPEQQKIMQEIKKSIKRITPKEIRD